MFRLLRPAVAPVLLLGAVLLLGGCRTRPVPQAADQRRGEEIVVAGQFFPAGTRVVTWLEAGGFDAYRPAPKFPPDPKTGEPVHFGRRQLNLPWWRRPFAPADRRLAAPSLADLRRTVDQFVLHYDGSGISRACFDALQHRRGLSVHFLLDADGTIYQTLDLQERAYHATIANSRSIGIEIANVGAYPPGDTRRFAAWYRRDAAGGTVMTVPPNLGDPRWLVPDFTPRPARPEPVTGAIHGTVLVQYDYTPEQYAALAKLVAALCRVFPRLAADFPRGADGTVLLRRLDAREFARFRGVLGHWHVQANKIDPGPALHWERVLAEAQAGAALTSGRRTPGF